MKSSLMTLSIDNSANGSHARSTRRKAPAQLGKSILQAVALLATGIASLGSAPAMACSGDEVVSQTLPTGSRWELCWQPQAAQGIVLSDVFYTTATGTRRKVLDEVALAQLFLSYDDGSSRTSLLSDAGLGGNALVALAANDCAQGTRLISGGAALVCSTVRQRGYIYKYYTNQRQGHLLELTSQARLAGRTFSIRWRLHDDGVIEPAVGVSEQFDAVGNDPRYGWELGGGIVGLGSILEMYWRIDFDLGGNGANDIVEEIEVTPSANRRRKVLSINRLSTEAGRDVNLDRKRSWRVRDAAITNSDGRPVSYQLEPLRHGHDYRGGSAEPWARYPLYITRDAACERLVSGNSGAGGCGLGINDFVNGQNINGADVVFWYGLTHHRVPRAEDDPFSTTRWHGFALSPRDWTATNPLAASQFAEPRS